MTDGLQWGLPVIAYLFLAGLGAGALTVSASVMLRGGGGGFGGEHTALARYGAFLAPIPAMIGSGLLIFELGSFEAGRWFAWINLYKVINLSPMSIGTWLLTLFIVVSVAYAYTFLPNAPGLDKEREGPSRALAWVSVPLGISVAVYTGVLLGAMPARPFWNSPVLAMLFLLSSLSTGVAAIMLARALIHRRSAEPEAEKRFQESGYLLTASDTLLIGFEILAVFLFLMFAYLTVGDVKYAVSVILFGGDVYTINLAAMFWIWVVVVGLVVPGLVELFYAVPKLVYHRPFKVPRAVELAVPVAVLIGGFMLRYVVVIAGQVTGPIGI